MIYGTWSPGGSCSANELAEANSTDYAKYQLPLGCPGTGKTQVVKRLIHMLIEEEYSVTVCAPLGLLATNYREEFYPDLQADTIHTHFSISLVRRTNSTWLTTTSGSTMPSSLTRLRWSLMTPSI